MTALETYNGQVWQRLRCHSIPPLHQKVKTFPGKDVLTRFQGPGGWYIENSLTTIGQKDPLGELNRELWNSGHDVRQRDCS